MTAPLVLALLKWSPSWSSREGQGFGDPGTQVRGRHEASRIGLFRDVADTSHGRNKWGKCSVGVEAIIFV